MELNFYKDNQAQYFNHYVDEWFGVDYYYSLIDREQPENVCINCNYEFGYWTCVGPGLNKAPQNLMKSHGDWHYGECEICGKQDNLTHPKHYGYLYKGWKDKRK